MSNRANHTSAQGQRLEADDDVYRPDDATDWEYVRETLRLLVERDGMPAQLDDLSVDELSERRLTRSDFAGIIKIWRKPSGAEFHPAIGSHIATALRGRDPEIYTDSDPLTIYMNVEDESTDTKAAVEFFGLRLALILGGLPRVVVGRYRGFDSEDQGQS